jgi:hypothetical protein
VKQVLLKDARNVGLLVWAPDSTELGDRVRWNGAPWFVSSVYGTRFCRGLEARRRERPEEPEEDPCRSA